MSVRPRSPCERVGQTSSALCDSPTAAIIALARSRSSALGVQRIGVSMVAVIPVNTTSPTVSEY